MKPETLKKLALQELKDAGIDTLKYCRDILIEIGYLTMTPIKSEDNRYFPNFRLFLGEDEYQIWTQNHTVRFSLSTSTKVETIHSKELIRMMSQIDKKGTRKQKLIKLRMDD